MDARLPLFGPNGGRQVWNLTLDDVPEVAHAIVACIEGRAAIGRVYSRNHVSMVYLRGPGIDRYIRGEDWLLIAPYLVDGTFNPLATSFVLGSGENPDADLYRRVSGILAKLFPHPFPTSKL